MIGNQENKDISIIKERTNFKLSLRKNKLKEDFLSKKKISIYQLNTTNNYENKDMTLIKQSHLFNLNSYNDFYSLINEDQNDFNDYICYLLDSDSTSVYNNKDTNLTVKEDLINTYPCINIINIIQTINVKVTGEINDFSSENNNLNNNKEIDFSDNLLDLLLSILYIDQRKLRNNCFSDFNIDLYGDNNNNNNVLRNIDKTILKQIAMLDIKNLERLYNVIIIILINITSASNRYCMMFTEEETLIVINQFLTNMENLEIKNIDIYDNLLSLFFNVCFSGTNEKWFLILYSKIDIIYNNIFSFDIENANMYCNFSLSSLYQETKNFSFDKSNDESITKYNIITSHYTNILQNNLYRFLFAYDNGMDLLKKFFSEDDIISDEKSDSFNAGKNFKPFVNSLINLFIFINQNYANLDHIITNNKNLDIQNVCIKGMKGLSVGYIYLAVIEILKTFTLIANSSYSNLFNNPYFLSLLIDNFSFEIKTSEIFDKNKTDTNVKSFSKSSNIEVSDYEMDSYCNDSFSTLIEKCAEENFNYTIRKISLAIYSNIICLNCIVSSNKLVENNLFGIKKLIFCINSTNLNYDQFNKFLNTNINSNPLSNEDRLNAVHLIKNSKEKKLSIIKNIMRCYNEHIQSFKNFVYHGKETIDLFTSISNFIKNNCVLSFNQSNLHNINIKKTELSGVHFSSLKILFEEFMNLFHIVLAESLKLHTKQNNELIKDQLCSLFNKDNCWLLCFILRHSKDLNISQIILCCFNIIIKYFEGSIKDYLRSMRSYLEFEGFIEIMSNIKNLVKTNDNHNENPENSQNKLEEIIENIEVFLIYGENDK